MLRGLLWNLAGRMASQVMAFVISVILARILLPEEFGIIGMALVGIILCQHLVDLGLTKAVIQKKELDRLQLSSIFWIHFLLALILAVTFFFAAPYISSFFEEKRLVDFVKVFSVIFLINGVALLPNALLVKNMKFKLLAKIGLYASGLGGVIAIIMALNGFGIWSLVVQTFVVHLLHLIGVSIAAGWQPSFNFSLDKIKEIWPFSYKLFLAQFPNVLMERLDTVMVGKYFSPAVLGFYSRAQSLNNVIARNTTRGLDQVFFPAFSRLATTEMGLFSAIKESVKIMSFFATGLFALLWLVSDDLIITLLTDKWTASIPLFRLFLVSGYFLTLSIILENVLKAKGETGRLLLITTAKNLAILLCYSIAILRGLEAFLVSIAIVSFVYVFIASQSVARKTSISLKHLLMSIFESVPIGVVTFTISYYAMNTLFASVWKLWYVPILFVSIYYGLAVLIKNKGLEFFIVRLKSLIQSQKTA